MRERRDDAQARFAFRAGSRSRLEQRNLLAQRRDLVFQLAEPRRGRDRHPRRTACHRERNRGCNGPCRSVPAWRGCRPSSRRARHRGSPPNWRRSWRPSPTIDRTEDLRARTDHDPAFQGRVALAADPGRGIGAAQRHVLVDGDIVADLGGLADHGEAVIDEEIAADLARPDGCRSRSGCARNG